MPCGPNYLLRHTEGRDKKKRWIENNWNHTGHTLSALFKMSATRTNLTHMQLGQKPEISVEASGRFTETELFERKRGGKYIKILSRLNNVQQPRRVIPTHTKNQMCKLTGIKSYYPFTHICPQ